MNNGPLHQKRNKKNSLPTEVAKMFGPGCLAGIRFGDWWKLLAENSFHVDARYWGRAVHLTASSLITSPVSWLENLFHGPMLESTQAETPLFVLGSWRSGTTHLHNLLCQDDRFSAPDLFQTMYPHTFRSARWWLEPLLAALTPRQRFMDNMKMSLREPAEDEMAIGILCRKSSSFSWVFPRQAEKYDRYLSFEQATPKDRAAFRQALKYFVAKVQRAANDRPLILKSPHHTARIELILEAFPDAKFLHIHRNPYEVFQSFVHMAQKVPPAWALQKYDFSHLHEMVLSQYRQLYEAYFYQRKAIPPGQHYELSYEDLVANPILQLEQAYSHLQLPDFEMARPKFESYLETTKNYQRNKHLEIPNDLRKLIDQEWGFCFDAWGYPRENEQQTG